jgi:hypothetical protein
LTLLTSGLFESSYWIMLQFQNFAAVPFITFGTATALIFCLTRAHRQRQWQMTAAALVLVALVAASISAIQTMPVVGTDEGRVIAAPTIGASQGSALRAALAATPSDAEVIASNGVVGGFSQRSYVYELIYSTPTKQTRYGVHAPTMVVVIDTKQNNLLTPSAKTPAIATFLTSRYHARTLIDRDGVLLLLWHPPPHQRVLAMP